MIDDDNIPFNFRSVAILFAVISTAIVVGRICSAESKDRRTPFFSANDRSRWCTISALVDHGTYAIDDVIQRRGWDSIDKVRHADRAGVMRHYSSKPTLYPTMLAGKYWLVKKISGASLVHEPFYAGRVVLLLANLPLLALFFFLIAKMIDEFATSEWTKTYVMAAAGFGTFLTTMANSLSNHLPAAVCVVVVIWAVVRIWRNATDPDFDETESNHDWRLFTIAGLAASFTAANELPALSFFALVSLVVFLISRRHTLTAYLPACAVVGVGFFGTNYVAHDSLKPPYAHRSDDQNWYDYPGSYWMGEKQGVDKGEPSRARYAFHVFIGHYGIFSLTPIWLLSLIGLAIWSTRGETEHRVLAVATFLLMAVCLTFYIALRSQKDRNYGGVSCGFRWMFWFIPMWLLLLIPAVDRFCQSRIGRGIAILFLAVSVFSASYPMNNPWVSPWIYQYWSSLGWI